MIVIIDYGAGNVKSVQNAIESLGFEATVSSDASLIQQADKVIFPGVGEASSAMEVLKAKGLDQLIPALKQDVLGICLGLQLMCQSTEEGNADGLGIFDTMVKRFPDEDIVPQMGWNNLINKKSQLMKGIEADQDVYFVHSYYAELCKDTSVECDYILSFSAVLEKDNFYATQFHPEKSGAVGQQILKNFLELGIEKQEFGSKEQELKIAK